MGVVVFLIVCWLVAYGAAGGWSRTSGHLAGVADRLRHAAAVPALSGAAPARPVGMVGPDGVGAGAAAAPQAPPTLADLEFPVREPDGPSMEGRLVTALLAGAVSLEHYHKAMHVLAAHDERAHPMPPVPS